MKRAVVLVLFLVVGAVGQPGGGSVDNVAPVVELIAKVATVSNSQIPPEEEQFNMTVRDNNGVGDVERVELRFYHAPTSTTTPEFTQVFSAPFVGGYYDVSGYNDVPDDTVFEIFYNHSWSSVFEGGAWEIEAFVVDFSGASFVYSTRDTTQVNAGAQIVADSCPYDSAGVSQSPNCRWGLWVAVPGDTDVESVNYLRVENTGSAAGDVAVSWVQSMFSNTNASYPGANISIDGNMKFHVGAGSSPAATTFTASATDADGSYSFGVAAGVVMWVKYSIDGVPNGTPPGDYVATFTFG